MHNGGNPAKPTPVTVRLALAVGYRAALGRRNRPVQDRGGPDDAQRSFARRELGLSVDGTCFKAVCSREFLFELMFGPDAAARLTA